MRLFFNISIILLSVSLTIPNAALSEEVIRLTNGEWPPYLSHDLEHFGPVSRIVREAFQLEGVEVQYEFFPWKRAYEVAKSGSWDGSVVYAWSKQRGESFYFSEGIVLETQDVFFHRKDFSFKWKSYENLRGMVVGASLGYIYGAEFEEAENTGIFEVERVTDDVLNFNKLLRGRIDVFATTKEVGYAFLNKHFRRDQVDQITNHPRPTRESKFYLILTKKRSKNVLLMEKFDLGLKALKKSGKWQKILNDSLLGEL